MECKQCGSTRLSYVGQMVDKKDIHLPFLEKYKDLTLWNCADCKTTMSYKGINSGPPTCYSCAHRFTAPSKEVCRINRQAIKVRIDSGADCDQYFKRSCFTCTWFGYNLFCNGQKAEDCANYLFSRR